MRLPAVLSPRLCQCGRPWQQPQQHGAAAQLVLPLLQLLLSMLWALEAGRSPGWSTQQVWVGAGHTGNSQHEGSPGWQAGIAHQRSMGDTPCRQLHATAGICCATSKV